MALPRVQAIAQVVELVDELIDGFKVMGFNAIARVNLEGRGPVFIVPRPFGSQHAIAARDFKILRRGHFEAEGELCGDAMGKFIQGRNCLIHLFAKFACGIDADGIGIGNETGVVRVVTAQIIDRAAALCPVETPVEVGFSAGDIYIYIYIKVKRFC